MSERRCPPSCPAGHDLERWLNRTSTLRCDGGCGEPLCVREWRWSCTLCDYDVCEGCVDLAQVKLVATPLLDAAKLSAAPTAAVPHATGVHGLESVKRDLSHLTPLAAAAPTPTLEPDDGDVDFGGLLAPMADLPPDLPANVVSRMEARRQWLQHLIECEVSRASRAAEHMPPSDFEAACGLLTAASVGDELLTAEAARVARAALKVKFEAERSALLQLESVEVHALLQAR